MVSSLSIIRLHVVSLSIYIVCYIIIIHIRFFNFSPDVFIFLETGLLIDRKVFQLPNLMYGNGNCRVVDIGICDLVIVS